MHSFGHKNISVRQIFIYSKTKGVIKFDSGQNWPTGVLYPKYINLSNGYFHWVAQRVLQQCCVVNIQAQDILCNMQILIRTCKQTYMVIIKHNLRIFRGIKLKNLSTMIWLLHSHYLKVVVTKWTAP